MAKNTRFNPNTKYYPPRILEKLDFIQAYPFTLIEAPSGFGKTTLLEHFFDDQLCPSIPRYTYDFESDEPLYIWKQICQRIGKIDPVCGNRLQQSGPPDEDNLTEIHEALQDLDCPAECYLWLDNYKRWSNPFSGDFLNQLARHGGKKLHVVVSTQPLSMDRRRSLHLSAASWQILDEDIAFRPEDIAEYFLAAGFVLTREQIMQVFQLTEGWIMALSLQMLCFMEHGQFEQGGMTSLMEHAFWERLSDTEQDFLLHISIFPKFSLGQATALLGMSSADTDRVLRDKRYFIHFDAESRYFYPHSQLRVLLKEHFGCLPPEKQKEIYLQGGALAEQERDRLNTLRFYYAADAWDRILEMPLSSYELADVMRADVHPIILDILEQTPYEIKLRHPRSILSMAFCLFIIGATPKLMEMRSELLHIIRDSSLPQQEKDSLEGEYELLVSFLEYNRISDMSQHHRRALKLLGGPAKLINPKSTWTFGSPSILFLYWRESGKLDEEMEEMDTCMPIYYKLSHGHGSGAELVMRAETYLMRGEVEKAFPLCYQALFVASQQHQDSIYQCSLFVLARLFFQQGNMDETAKMLDSIHELSHRHREDLSRYTYDLAASYIAILQGHLENVSAWLANGDITDKRLVLMTQPLAHIIYGRCLLLQKDYYKLLGASQYFIGLSNVFSNLLAQVYTHIYCAVAQRALGENDLALEHLQKALDLALPDQLYLPFAEMYPSIQYMLPSMAIGLHEQEKIEKLTVAFMQKKTDEPEPFTAREQEIHVLLKGNLTNKQIAEKLGISPNTVRNSVSVMLKKRGFKARIQLQELD